MASAKAKAKLNRIIRNRNEARMLAEQIVADQKKIDEFQEQVKKLAAEYGIDKVQFELPSKKQRLLDFMSRADMNRLDMGELGYVNRVQAISEHVWIATDADMSVSAPEGTRSLRSILGKELFMRATRRVVDPARLQELIDENEITEEEVAPAHYTRMRAPYIRFEGGK